MLLFLGVMDSAPSAAGAFVRWVTVRHGVRFQDLWNSRRCRSLIVLQRAKNRRFRGHAPGHH